MLDYLVSHCAPINYQEDKPRLSLVLYSTTVFPHVCIFMVFHSKTLLSNRATSQNFIDQTLTNPLGKTARRVLKIETTPKKKKRSSVCPAASCLQQQVNRPAPRSWWIKRKRKNSNWMWISLFGSSWIPPRMNKAIICNIRHSSSFPPRAFFFSPPLMAPSFS